MGVLFFHVYFPAPDLQLELVFAYFFVVFLCSNEGGRGEEGGEGEGAEGEAEKEREYADEENDELVICAPPRGVNPASYGAC